MYQIFKKHPTICTDSRKVEPGCLFFALRGDNFDGNRYAGAALEAGAAWAVVDDATLIGDRFIVVEDVLTTLQNLAREHRHTLDIPIIALTGSNGKTTTKEFLKRVLSTRYRVNATAGNLNNHIGVPLTLLGFTQLTEIGIVEMGANHPHEIQQLCSIAEPNVGLITNIGRAHLEGFGSDEGIRRAKGELFDYLQKSGGTAIFNTNDKVLSEMIAQRRGLNHKGYDPRCEPLEMSIYGDYNQLNAQAAYAMGLYFGVDKQLARIAIKSYTPDNNRSQRVVTARNTLYLDAYNANPSSMRAAIENFTSLPCEHKIVILGEMRELGDYCEREHSSIINLAEGRFEQIILVGDNYLHCKGDNLYFKNVAALTEQLATFRLEGKHILIKGSRGVALEHIVPLL